MPPKGSGWPGGRAPSAQEIKLRRERAGISQTKAARMVYSTLRSWQNWEGGAGEMHPGLWELFCIKVSLFPVKPVKAKTGKP